MYNGCEHAFGFQTQIYATTTKNPLEIVRVSMIFMALRSHESVFLFSMRLFTQNKQIHVKHSNKNCKNYTHNTIITIVNNIFKKRLLILTTCLKYMNI